MDEFDHLAMGVALSKVPGIGKATAGKLLNEFGDLEAIFKADLNDLNQVSRLSDRAKEELLKKNEFSAEQRQVEEVLNEGGRVTLFTDHEYPYRLALCHDAPQVLFSKGLRTWNEPRIVAVVGMRQASEYGKRACQELVRGLQKSNAVVVSGLAFGIDILAHRAAAEVGLSSLACLAHGLDMIYPRLHQKDAIRMQESGALITEYPFGTNPDRMNFPSRNRIIAGLADVTIVVQSESKGGSMITAKLAHSYHRDVMAIPGSINDRRSQGCHELIQFHIASLISSSDDVMRFMNWQPKVKPKMELFVELNRSEEKVIELISSEKASHIDAICHDSGLSRGEVMSVLLSLELKGFVTAQPGSSFLRTRG